MPVAVGIWLLLLGYTVAWAGWQNMGITYAPQTDGSVIPSATPVTLLGAFTCKAPTIAPASSSTSQLPIIPAQPGSPLMPSPVPSPQPGLSILNPIAVPQPLPRPRRGPAPPPQPGPIPVPGGGILTGILQGIESLLLPVVAGLRR